MCNDACPGLFIEESMLIVYLLLNAADVAMVNNRIVLLQRQLNITSEFCSKYDISINMSKTNVMIFRNGGRLKPNEKVYINNKTLAETTYYKYLGLIFSPDSVVQL